MLVRLSSIPFKELVSNVWFIKIESTALIEWYYKENMNQKYE